MSSSTNASAGGGSFLVEGLTILFVALKLTGVIGWSWWWVLSPLWISGIAIAVVFLIAVILYLIYDLRR